MPRFTNQTFKDLAIWMVVFGALAGVAIPLLMLALGIPSEYSLRWWNFPFGLVVGTALGVLNFQITQRVVRPELRELVQSMRVVEDAFREATFTGDWSACTNGNCNVEVRSDDEIGETAEAFNELVAELIRVQTLEAASSELSETLSSKLDLEELADHAIELLIQHTDAVAGSLLVEKDDVLTVVANHGLSDPSRLTRSDHVRRAMKTNEVQYVRVNPAMMIEGVVADFKPSQVLVFPIAFEDHTLGTLVLAADKLFGKDALWLLRIFQQGMGLALNNALTHDRLQQIASRDPLTSLYNRRFGMERLKIEFEQATHHHCPLSVIMFDIDFFKKINDTYGHLAGDQVLVEVAAVTRKVLRDSDVFVRYGGEEFLIVMPGANCEVVARVGERLRAAIEGYTFTDGEQVMPITVSVGVSEHTVMMKTSDDLLRRADDALYAAKEGGRNKVVSLSPKQTADSKPAREVVPQGDLVRT
jgi:diguanylate cyclase (GGDEF)-like protein